MCSHETRSISRENNARESENLQQNNYFLRIVFSLLRTIGNWKWSYQQMIEWSLKISVIDDD